LNTTEFAVPGFVQLNADSQRTAFTGTVVKTGGKYVLKTSDMNYQLDDQQKAKRFVGQQVQVSGNLDTNTSTIHVSDISPAS
jgi:lipopolysaccharide export system protein LptA